MITMSLKDLKIEFNAEPVLRAEEEGTAKWLGKAGAMTRAYSRNSIKTVSSMDDHAPPGDPPHGHTGNPRYKDWIFFYVDRASREMLCGPLLLPKTTGYLTIVPEVLEYGGNVFIDGHGVITTVYQEARQHMRPALGVVIEKLPELVENSIVPT